MIKVKNMVSTRTGVPVANQFIIENNGVETFQSYETTIAIRQANGVVVLDDGAFDYSRITTKYLKEFLRGDGRKEVERSIASNDLKYVFSDLNPEA